MAAVREAAPLPTVHSYLDYRKFLAEWLEAKQAVTPGYTLSRFSRKAGCSYSHVRNVFAGERKLLPPQLDGFIHALKLNPEDAEFFTILVRYQQSPSLLERAQLLQIISGTRKVREARPLEGEIFRYLSRLSYAALYELSFSPEFQEDPQWISGVLGISSTEAQEALRDLIAVGLLVRAEDGVVRPRIAVLKTPPGLKDAALFTIHDKGLEAAEEALGGPTEDRHFYAAVSPVPSTLVGALRQAVAGFHDRTNALLAEFQAERFADGNDDENVRSVYQVQVQLVPVSTIVPASDDGTD